MEIKNSIKQIEETFFVAFDGKKFKTSQECVHYEAVKSGKRKTCGKCAGHGTITCDNDVAGDGGWGSTVGVSYWQEPCVKCSGTGYLELNQDMEQEINYLKNQIAKYESSLASVGIVVAQNPDYAYTQKKLAEELKLLKSILSFIEKR